MVNERVVIKMKRKGLKVIAAVSLLLGIGISAVWILLSLVFPDLDGFLTLKTYALVILVTVVASAIYLIVGHAISKKSGLVLDIEGITDYSNIISVGFVPWKEITEIKEAKNAFGQKMFVVIVSNPDQYIQKTQRMKASRHAQYIQFGSPIIISAGMLDYDTEALLGLLREGATKTESRLKEDI